MENELRLETSAVSFDKSRKSENQSGSRFAYGLVDE